MYMWINNSSESRTATAIQRRAIRRHSCASRPSIEALEDRTVPAFLAPVSYQVGVTGPFAVVTADFNNDGQPDIAVERYSESNVDDSSVVILLGNADGTFQSPLTFRTGSYPRSLAVGDFDADGKLDLATANFYDVSVLRGNGDGTFQAPTNIAIASTPVSVAVGDFNGDGMLDLGVTSNSYTGDETGYEGYANVLIGNCNGSFSGPNTTPLGWGFHTAATAADLNSDGFTDFVTAQFYGTNVEVLWGDGSGYLQGPSRFTCGESPVSVAAGDVNGDGFTDLVTANWSTYASDIGVLLGDGLGNFTSAGNFATDLNPASVVLGDFTGDGHVDAATVNMGAYDVSVLRGHGDGSFSIEQITPVGFESWSLAAADFNRDGWLDAVTANYGGWDVSVLINDRSWTPAPPPTVNISDVTITEGNAGIQAAEFTVSLSAASSIPVTVFYKTTDGTAKEISDYQPASDMFTFAAGETSKTIRTWVFGDLVDEADESFTLDLYAAMYAVLGDRQGLGTILDDDSPPLPALTINDASVTEGNSGAIDAVFTVRLSDASAVPVTVDYSTANGTASAGTDYQTSSGTLTFAPGEVIKNIPVPINGDGLHEPNETFVVNLSGAANATISDAQGIGTIVDDEPVINIRDVTITEGNSGTRVANFIVALSNMSDQPVMVTYTTADRTAAAGSDYQSASGTLTIPAGQITGMITVLVNGDRVAEPNETFAVNLSGATNGLIADGEATGTIVDDEPRISIGDVAKNEGNRKKTTLFVFTVTLSAAYDEPVTVSFRTADGTATTNDGDYISKTGTLTFAPGETTKTITIEVKGDSKREADETFYVDLFGLSSNSLFTKNRGVGTIWNDD